MVDVGKQKADLSMIERRQIEKRVGERKGGQR